MSAIRVPWSSASFLVYVGGLTMLAATGSLLGVQATRHGSGGLVFWALVVLIVLVALASGAASAGHAVTAGLLALSVVAGFVIFLGALLNWFGWLANLDTLPFRGFHVSLLFLELATAAAAFVAWRVFRFPLHVIVIAAATWFFVTDLVSNGGDWSAVVTILVGFALLAAARLVDDVSAFWLHVGAGLAIGGGVLWFLHGGAADWIGVALIGLVYIAFGDLARRSSWIVLGAWGILQAASFFAEKWSGATLALVPFFYLFPFTSGFDEYGESHAHPWLGPLVFVAAGLLFIGTGLALVRRRGDAIPAADLL